MRATIFATYSDAARTIDARLRRYVMLTLMLLPARYAAAAYAD